MGPLRNAITLLALATTFGGDAVKVPRDERRLARERPRVDLSRPKVRAAIPGASRLGARRLRRLRNQAARCA